MSTSSSSTDKTAQDADSWTINDKTTEPSTEQSSWPSIERGLSSSDARRWATGSVASEPAAEHKFLRSRESWTSAASGCVSLATEVPRVSLASQAEPHKDLAAQLQQAEEQRSVRSLFKAATRSSYERRSSHEQEDNVPRSIRDRRSGQGSPVTPRSSASRRSSAEQSSAEQSSAERSSAKPRSFNPAELTGLGLTGIVEPDLADDISALLRMLRQCRDGGAGELGHGYTREESSASAGGSTVSV